MNFIVMWPFCLSSHKNSLARHVRTCSASYTTRKFKDNAILSGYVQVLNPLNVPERVRVRTGVGIEKKSANDDMGGDHPKCIHSS